jgi:hypothetical protein
VRTSRPKVFLSFAGNDRVMAERLADDLELYGVDAFYDARDVALGGNVVLSINRAMAESHYYVLLWSGNCVDRPWVDEEWAAAYAREINEERSFLFIVRLDTTPLPPLLAVRRYLDGIHDWPAVARDLADAWLDDLDTGTPVFPPPDPVPEIERSILVVKVRNQALVMTHVIGVSPESTGADLLPAIRTTLALPAFEAQLDGALKIQFSYRLLHDGEPVNDEPIVAQGITEGTMLDLEIKVEASGPDGPFGEKVYRSAADSIPSVSEKTVRAMVNTAFAHLLPWARHHDIAQENS